MIGHTYEQEASSELIYWVEERLAFPQQNGLPVVLGVSGPVASGKSTLARQLAAWVSSIGKATCTVLCIDEYVNSKPKRRKAHATSYDPSLYDLRQARADLVTLLSGTSVSRTYHTRTFVDFKVTQTISPSDVIVIEGIHALNSCFTPYLAGRIFIDADMPFAIGMRAIADLKDRGQTIEQAARRLADYYSYSRHAAHYITDADLVLQMQCRRVYQVKRARVV